MSTKTVRRGGWLWLTLALAAAGPVAGEVVHDNSTWWYYSSTLSPREVGDEILLAGTARNVRTIELFMWAWGGMDVVSDVWVRIYANDGPDGEPGTLLWEELFTGVHFYDNDPRWYRFDVPDVVVPDRITYTVHDITHGQFGGQLHGYREATIGGDEDWFWERFNGAWVKQLPGPGVLYNFGVRVSAGDPLPCGEDPASLECLELPRGEACLQAPAGLVAWWPLDRIENGITPDEAGTHHGTIQGPIHLANQGVVGTGLYIGGPGRKLIRVQDSSPSLDIGTSNRTMAAWVRTCTATPKQDIVSKTRTSLQDGGFRFTLVGGVLRLWMSTAGHRSLGFVGDRLIADNCWHHVAVTIDRGRPDGVQFYVDGLPDGSPSDPTPLGGGPIANQRDLSLGGLIGAGGLGNAMLRGWLDEVQIFNTALAPEEIEAIYLAGRRGLCPLTCVDPPPGAVAWFPFDTQATLAVDLTGCRDLDVAGDPQVVAGMVEGGLEITNQSFVYTPAVPCTEFGTGDFSIECWVRFSNEGTVYVWKENGGAGYVFGFDRQRLLAQLNPQGDGIGLWTEGVDLGLEQWHHLALTVDRDAPAGGVMYVDGSAIRTFDPSAYQGDLNTTAQFEIFARPGVRCRAVLDEVTLYNRVLTPLEVRGIVDAASRGKCK